MSGKGGRFFFCIWNYSMRGGGCEYANEYANGTEGGAALIVLQGKNVVNSQWLADVIQRIGGVTWVTWGVVFPPI